MYPDPFVVHFLALTPPLVGKWVLDAGSGAGRNTAYLAQHGATTMAVDVRPGALRQVQNRAPAASAALATLTALPFRGGAFGAAVCTSVLEYLTAAEAAASATELQRVLAPGGSLLVVTAAAEGSEPGYGPGPGQAPGAVARLSSQGDLAQWFTGCDTLELLHVKLVEPPTPPVRAQWVLIARRR